MACVTGGLLATGIDRVSVVAFGVLNLDTFSIGRDHLRSRVLHAASYFVFTGADIGDQGLSLAEASSTR